MARALPLRCFLHLLSNSLLCNHKACSILHTLVRGECCNSKTPHPQYSLWSFPVGYKMTESFLFFIGKQECHASIVFWVSVLCRVSSFWPAPPRSVTLPYGAVNTPYHESGDLLLHIMVFKLRRFLHLNQKDLVVSPQPRANTSLCAFSFFFNYHYILRVSLFYNMLSLLGQQPVYK